MSDFTLPAEEKWFRECGRYDNIEIAVEGDTIHCTVTDDETVVVADISDGVHGYNGHSHAWLRTELPNGGLGYRTACNHMSVIPSTMIGEVDSRHSLVDRVPCDYCKHELQ